MAVNTLKPIHLNLVAEGSSSTQTNLVNFFTSNNSAFTGLTAEGSSSSQTALHISGYTYLLNQYSLIPSEGAAVLDQTTMQVNLAISEGIALLDGLSTNRPTDPEGGALLDQVTTTVNLNISELMPVLDQVFANPTDAESGALLDQVKQGVTTTLPENVPIFDSTNVVAIITLYNTVNIIGTTYSSLFSSTFISLDSIISTGYYSTEIHSRLSNLVGATAASGTYNSQTGAYSPNPFGGSVFINGVEVV